MTTILVEVSSVVVANAHNPSILNHDWLVNNNLLPSVDGGWELAEPPFTTPPLSRIRYQNDISIALEPVRLTITAQTLGGTIPTAPENVVASLAIAYVQTLEHVPYSAVGSNFKAVVECRYARQRLVETFGGSGGWKQGLDALTVKLSHRKHSGCERNIEIVAGSAQKLEDDVSTSVEALLLSANYHRNTPTKDEAVCAVNETSSDLEDFMKFTSEFREEIDA